MRGLELRLTKEASLDSFPPSLGRFERFQVYSLVRSRHGYLISLLTDAGQKEGETGNRLLRFSSQVCTNNPNNQKDPATESYKIVFERKLFPLLSAQ